MSTLILIALLAQLKPEDYGRVEGTVTNAATGEPIRRAEVRLSPSERGPRDSGSLTTITDNAGRFALNQVAPGRFVLRPSRNGFVQKGFTQVSVSNGQTVSNLALTMLPQAVVTGRVTDEEGEPLARVTVTAYRYAYPQGRKTLVPAESDNTNDLGEFRLFGLSRGTYYLSAVSPSSGRGGGPRPGNDSEPLVPTFHPSAATPESATPIRLNPGTQLPNLDIQMRRSKTFRVSGHLTDATSGQPVSRASIFLSNGAGMMGAGMMGGGGPRTMSRDGQFSIGGVAPGIYTVIARTFGEGRGEMTAMSVGQLQVSVSNGDVADLRIAMRPPAVLQGIVKLDEGEVALSGVRVQLEALTPLNGGGMMGSGIKEGGKFSIANVMPGLYRLRMQNLPAEHFVKAIRQGNQDVHHTGIDSAMGGDLTVVLAPGAGSVEGIVKDGRDQPQPQVSAVLVPKEPWIGLADALRVTTSGADGVYRFAQVPPGEYELYAFEDAETGVWFDPDFRALYRDQAKSVRVEKGTATKQDLRAATMQ